MSIGAPKREDMPVPPEVTVRGGQARGPTVRTAFAGVFGLETVVLPGFGGRLGLVGS